ncbi:MAG: nucleotide exchange factor GrpE [Xanthomonadales bacterium]|nr:nucleotide exchange factor GrpE [Xanthomonadales bacterium]
MTDNDAPKTNGAEAESELAEESTGEVQAPEETNVDTGAPEQGGNESADPDVALAEAERQVANYKEAMLRMQAEMENLRKRLIQDLERSRKRALEGLVQDLLPVKDSLERGTETDRDTATVESLIEGKQLIIRMLDKALGDHGLQIIDPAGETFDPESHEAMAMVPSPEYEAGTVIEVMQKGYRLNDRLIRPARVVVSQAPSGD